jgi:hypothetical protein
MYLPEYATFQKKKGPYQYCTSLHLSFSVNDYWPQHLFFLLAPIFLYMQYRPKPNRKNFLTRDLIHTQHHHNNHTTTPHMRVGPSVWGPPSCEGLLCDCCVGVVNLTFSFSQTEKERKR